MVMQTGSCVFDNREVHRSLNTDWPTGLTNSFQSFPLCCRFLRHTAAVNPTPRVMINPYPFGFVVHLCRPPATHRQVYYEWRARKTVEGSREPLRNRSGNSS